MEEHRELVMMSMKVRADVAEKVKYLAKRVDLTQSRLLANIVETVIPDLMLCDKIGVFQLSYLLRDLQEELKGWVADVKERGLKESARLSELQ